MKACCENPENRSQPEQIRDDLTITTCKVCGRRHFELAVDAGKLGLRFEEER